MERTRRKDGQNWGVVCILLGTLVMHPPTEQYVTKLHTYLLFIDDDLVKLGTTHPETQCKGIIIISKSICK